MTESYQKSYKNYRLKSNLKKTESVYEMNYYHDQKEKRPGVIPKRPKDTKYALYKLFCHCFFCH